MAQVQVLEPLVVNESLYPPPPANLRLTRTKSGGVLAHERQFRCERRASVVVRDIAQETDPPLTWDELNHDSLEELLSKFRRSARVNKSLENIQDEVGSAYASWGARLCAVHLDTPTFLLPDGRMNVNISEVRTYQFDENEFPFFLEPTVGHYTIYATYDISDDSVQRICEDASNGSPHIIFRHPDIIEELDEGQRLHIIHVFVQLGGSTIKVEKSKRQSFVPPPITRGVSVSQALSMPWARLEEASKIEYGLADLSLEFTRTEESEKQYKAARAERAKNYANIGAKILTVELGLPGFVGEDGRLDCVVPEGTRVFALTENPFPYDLEHGIGHHVLFATYTMSQEEIDEVISTNFAGYKVLYYENPPHRKSIPTVWHIQIFVKKMTKQRDSFSVEANDVDVSEKSASFVCVE